MSYGPKVTSFFVKGITPGIRTLLVTSADPKFMRAHAQ